MNRQRADMAAGLLVAAVVAVGLLFTWDAYRQRQAFEEMGDGMMGDGSGMMGSMMNTTPDPIWYLLGTLVVGVVLAGGYLLLREELQGESGASAASGAPNGLDPEMEAEPPMDELDDDGSDEDQEATSPGATGKPDLLNVLPDDERRVLEPVIDEPGLTQIALRDRAEFSKSKISQTVSELEKRGLLYREKQGRTFRVYPDEDLER